MKSYTKYRKRKKVQEKTKCSKTRQITTSAFTKSRCIITHYVITGCTLLHLHHVYQAKEEANAKLGKIVNELEKTAADLQKK